VPTDRYFEVKHKTNLAVYQAIGRSGLRIPLPQREVQLLGGASA
jgi:small-conductance mechanosensitive channel